MVYSSEHAYMIFIADVTPSKKTSPNRVNFTPGSDFEEYYCKKDVLVC